MEKRKNQIKTIEKIVKFNKNKKTNFLYLKHALLEYIFQLKINSTSKVMLIYLLKNINLGNHHLYVVTPYKKLSQDLNISINTAIKSFKALQANKLLFLYSGKNKKRNTLIKEYIYKQEQFKLYTPYQNNIINLTSFYKSFFIYQDKPSSITQ